MESFFWVPTSPKKLKVLFGRFASLNNFDETKKQGSLQAPHLLPEWTFFYFFPNSVLISATDATARIFLPPYTAAPGIESNPRPVEYCYTTLEPFGRSTDWATAPRLCTSWPLSFFLPTNRREAAFFYLAFKIKAKNGGLILANEAPSDLKHIVRWQHFSQKKS